MVPVRASSVRTRFGDDHTDDVYGSAASYAGFGAPGSL
jgi:hypothetical protein